MPIGMNLSHILSRRKVEKTFAEFLASNPVVIPETACGHYKPVGELIKFWEWSELVCKALIAGEKVPHKIVKEYLEKSVTNALPPLRRKDYPDLAERFPNCYELKADGTRMRV
jgi:hypothetical protein